MKATHWWQNTAVYQIYPKSFNDTRGKGTGDLRGITEKLDYLKSLGAGALWLTPVYPSPMVDNGYDISDYCGIHPDFGTLADMEELIAEAKKRGMRIVMDLVYNHTSDEHPWFLESKKSRTNAKSDWYIWRDAKEDGSAPTNWRGIFGGSAWTYSEERGQYYLHTFAEAQPDLNWENPEVREALFAAANFWLAKGVGGFRIDAITYIKKPAVFTDGEPDAADGMTSVHDMTANTPGILDFLHEFRARVFDGHDIFTVGEANGVTPEELPLWVGENGVFSMLFEFSHVLVPYEGGECWHKALPWPLTKLKRALTASQHATAKEGWFPIYFENHDRARSVNYFFPKGADKKLAAKALAAVLFTLRGTPFIYEGEELGMTNVAWDSIDAYDDISSHGQYALALEDGFSKEEALGFVHFNSRDNARTPMQWTAERHAGFTSGTPWLPVNENYRTLNAAAEEKDTDSVLHFYRKLAKLRETIPALLDGVYEELLEENEQIYAFSRTLGKARIKTAVNFSTKDAALPADFLRGTRLAGSYADAPTTSLRPLEAVIYEEEIQ
ncbi:glycoside hydrolase family 13 protein [Selenomonas sputigena]|uniref:Alpha amylase, catalytic domain protein n=1 Tax=Selenomonas sputigena (strain ATCC 35185 / DSM 20758 / CCUG 44933 / VPI D19B-28) TaxID=546271 RepID=C9LRQ5_SELS3|nr:alpha-glucosidase [Selenomonas sputigena]AEC00839.1 Oligo-1,6-glucosidase [Selenomonas sputigena ATCC 35185]EEX78521.1 alpha amylase, catalytic domain protein [Selenomonas sputigena ATCC 35185]